MKKESTPHQGNTSAGNEDIFARQALQVVNSLPSLLLDSGMNPDYAIDESLARVGRLFGASRAYVMLDEKGGKYLRNTHEWVNESIGPTMFSWPLYDYEYDIPSMKNIITENQVFFGHTKDMPQDLLHVLGKQGVASFILSPILRDGKRSGLVGLDFCTGECNDPGEHTNIVINLAGVVALALERKQYQTLRKKIYTICNTLSDIELGHMDEQGEDLTSPPQPGKPSTLIDVERRYIIETLELYNGNKLKAAKHLGLTWPSLDRRCKKLGIVARRK